MLLPLTVSCFCKIRIGFSFLVPARLGNPGKGPLYVCVCVCVCVLLFVNLRWLNLLTHPNVHRVDYMAELNNRESVCNVAAVNHCER